MKCTYRSRRKTYSIRRLLSPWATIKSDRSPQTSSCWGPRGTARHPSFSTIEGRQKARNLRRDPRVSVLIHDADDPGRYVEVRGSVTMTHDGGPELIEQLSQAYEGVRFSGDDGTERVRIVVRLTPATLGSRSA